MSLEPVNPKEAPLLLQGGERSSTGRRSTDINPAVSHDAAPVIRALVDSVPVPTMIVSKDLRVLSTSPSLRKLLKVDRSVYGEDIAAIESLSGKALRSLLQESIDFLEPRDADALLFDQQWVHINTKPYRDHLDRIEGLIVTFSDVQELLESKRSLQSERDLAHEILNRVSSSVVLVDQSGCISEVNTTFRSLAKLKDADLRGWFFVDLVRNLWGEEDIADRMRILQSAEESSTFSWEHVAATAHKRLSFTGHALRVDGNPKTLLFIEDVTRIRNSQQLQTKLAAHLVSQTDAIMARLRHSEAELKQLTEHLLTAQEDEKKRMARELHDDLGQRLSLLALNLHRIHSSDPDHEAELAAITASLDEINSDLREISHQMHPAALKQLGLVVALKALVEDFGKAEEMPVTFATSGIPPTINETTSLVAYRIAQEALRNISKHAGKTHVKIHLQYEDVKLILSIKDDGVGFDEESLHAGDFEGLGFISMRERARLVHGTVTVTSQLGSGTQVTAILPNPPVQP